MKKIVMIDYYGNCDIEGKSVGHSPKVLVEYRNLLIDEYRVGAILPKSIIDEIDTGLFETVEQLPYQIVEDNTRKIFKRIVDKLKLFRNIKWALKKADGDVLWFYRTDFFFFFYVWLCRMPKNKKKICLVCQQKFASGWLGKILDGIYRKGIRKFDGVIYTQKSIIPHHGNVLYMPDYYYDNNKYDKYQNVEKEEKVVCLGTMNPYKQLEELVDVFNRNKMRLEIVGRFFDDAWHQKLKRKAKANILIENKILSEEDYYQKLAGAQYAILPYDMDQYEGRTSGVLLETVFMQTIPIAPKRLLKENGIVGLGYENLFELLNGNVNEWRYSEHFEDFQKEQRRQLDKEEIQRNILYFVNCL